MISALTRLSRISVGAIVAAALSASASAGSTDYYLKIKGVEGDSGKTAASSDKPRIAVLEVQSWSWGATQAAKQLKQDSIAIKQSGASAASGHANDRLRNAGPIDGWPSAQAGEAEITLKGRSVTENAGRAKPSDVTLKRGTSAAAGGVRVAVGDVDGDGSTAASAPAYLNRNRQKEPLTAPLDRGSVSLELKSVWPGCTVGIRYSELELGGDGTIYRLKDAVVTSCSGSRGDRPTESISLNYAKIEL